MSSSRFAVRRALPSTRRDDVRYTQAWKTAQADIDPMREVVLVLDARSRIQHCDRHNPFIDWDETWTEKPINALIPDLPLREQTPGYNIAYVRYWFANHAWQRHLARSVRGALLPVDLHLRTIPLGRGYCLLGTLRFAVAMAEDARLKAPCPDYPPCLPLGGQGGRHAPLLNFAVQ